MFTHKRIGSHRENLIWSVVSFALLRNVCPRIEALWLRNPEYWLPKTSWKDFSPCVKQFLRWILNAVSSYVQLNHPTDKSFYEEEANAYQWCSLSEHSHLGACCLSRNHQTQKFTNSGNMKQKSYLVLQCRSQWLSGHSGTQDQA